MGRRKAVSFSTTSRNACEHRLFSVKFNTAVHCLETRFTRDSFSVGAQWKPARKRSTERFGWSCRQGVCGTRKSRTRSGTGLEALIEVGLRQYDGFP
jgi:hypothetical protein